MWRRCPASPEKQNLQEVDINADLVQMTMKADTSQVAAWELETQESGWRKF